MEQVKRDWTGKVIPPRPEKPYTGPYDDDEASRENPRKAKVTQREALSAMKANNRDTSGDGPIYGVEKPKAPEIAYKPTDKNDFAGRPIPPRNVKARTGPFDDDEAFTQQRLANRPAAAAAATPAAAPAAAAPAARPKPKPKTDPNAELRADLLANKRADDAARAAAERKRQEADEFSSKLKGATKKGGNKTGYDAYKSLMGE